MHNPFCVPPAPWQREGDGEDGEDGGDEEKGEDVLLAHFAEATAV